MADTTTVMALPFPEGTDANDVPADVQALASSGSMVSGTSYQGGLSWTTDDAWPSSLPGSAV